MNLMLLATCAAASLIGLPALAQTAPPPPLALSALLSSAPIIPAIVEAAPTAAAGQDGASADTARADIPTRLAQADAAPLAAPEDLAPGARVVDPAGAELGQVVGVTKSKPKLNQQAFCILERHGVTVALPVSSITLADGALTARQTRAEVWGTP